MKNVMFVQTKCAGGKELAVVVVITWIWRRRSVFFYYLALLALVIVIVAYFKLAYQAPRPYMINSDIKPITCVNEFGNPSGHSMAS